jgi:DNA-binding MarR family transcriptional regulator
LPKGNYFGGVAVTAFDDEELARLRVALARITRSLDRRTRGDLLTRTQFSALATIARRGPVRVSEVAELEGVNPTMLSRILGKLEDAGLVRRSPDPADGRVSHVRVTDAGAELHRRLRAERTKLLAAQLAVMPQERGAALLAALPALESLAEHLAGPRPPPGPPAP